DPDAGRHGHGSRMPGAAHVGDDVLDLAQRRIGDTEQALAGRGEGHAAMTAMQQCRAEAILERPHLAADRRLAEAELVGRLRDAHAATHRDEAAQQVQGGEPGKGDGALHGGTHGAWRCSSFRQWRGGGASEFGAGTACVARMPAVPSTPHRAGGAGISSIRIRRHSRQRGNAMSTSHPGQSERAAAFIALHEAARGFVIPNPWDAGSARLLQSMGFKALASTSAGFAFSRARPDYGIERNALMSHLAELVAATSLPINADLENGFGDDPAECARTIELAAAAGVSGGS